MISPAPVRIEYENKSEWIFGLYTIEQLPFMAKRGSRIFFTKGNKIGNCDVYSMNADGSDIRNLTTTHLYNERFPSVSDDGSRVAFIKTKGPIHYLYIMDSNGMNMTKVHYSFERFYPVISPDGSFVIFSSLTDWGSIWAIDVNGNNLRRLAKNIDFFAKPSFTPDGKIIYGSDGEIWSMDADGNNRTMVISGNASNPAVSPDGSMIAFIRTEGLKKTVCITDIEGNGARNIALATNGPIPHSIFAQFANVCSFSPDGKYLVFTGKLNQEVRWNLYTVNVDGSELKQITSSYDNRNHFDCCWK